MEPSDNNDIILLTGAIAVEEVIIQGQLATSSTDESLCARRR